MGKKASNPRVVAGDRISGLQGERVMARTAESNGVKETLLRLFGHDDDRSLLAKLARMEPLKKHRVDPDNLAGNFTRDSAALR